MEKTKVIYKMFNEMDYNKITWVLKALEKNGKEQFSKVVKVEATRNGSRLICTNMQRIHIVEIKTKIEPGLYEKPEVSKESISFGTPLTESITYPAWKGLATSGEDRGTLDMVQFNSKTEMLSVVTKNLLSMTNEIVDMKFIEELPSKHKWRVYASDGSHKPVVFKDSENENSLCAVFAPIAA